jgi:hypothetical protein
MIMFLVTPVKEITLETSITWEYISSVYPDTAAWKQSDDSLIFSDRRTKLVHFDKNYKEIFRLDRKGKGPGEFNKIHSALFRDQGYVISDARDYKVQFLNKKGEYLNHINFPAGAIIPIDDKLYGVDRTLHSNDDLPPAVLVSLEDGLKPFMRYPEEILHLEFWYGALAIDHFFYDAQCYFITNPFTKAFGYDLKTGRRGTDLVLPLKGFDPGKIELVPGKKEREIYAQKSDLHAADVVGDLAAFHYTIPSGTYQVYTSKVALVRLDSEKATFLGSLDLPGERRLIGIRGETLHMLKMVEQDNGYAYQVDVYAIEDIIDH